MSQLHTHTHPHPPLPPLVAIAITLFVFVAVARNPCGRHRHHCLAALALLFVACHSQHRLLSLSQYKCIGLVTEAAV